MPSSSSSLRTPDAPIDAPAVSRCVAGTQLGAMTSRRRGRPQAAWSIQRTPAAPWTFAISWGSTTAVPVPRGTTARANCRGVAMLLSTWMCASMKAGASTPFSAWVSRPS